jgi:hypothetical protein
MTSEDISITAIPKFTGAGPGIDARYKIQDAGFKMMISRKRVTVVAISGQRQKTASGNSVS